MTHAIPVNDKELEQRASVDPDAREELRQFVAANAKQQAEEIIKAQSLDRALTGELESAGMRVFDMAFNIYLKYGGTFEERTAFAPYFSWWARQSMLEHLETAYAIRTHGTY